MSLRRRVLPARGHGYACPSPGSCPFEVAPSRTGSEKGRRILLPVSFLALFGPGVLPALGSTPEAVPTQAGTRESDLCLQFLPVCTLELLSAARLPSWGVCVHRHVLQIYTDM